MTDTKDRLRDYYDRNASVYEVKHGVTLAGNEHNFARHYEPFLRDAVPEQSHVLEIGCGTGVYTRWLLDRGCSVVGMDISGNILAEARARCPEATLVQGDCEDPAASLPEATVEARFDVILGVNTFSYYPHKAAALARYRRLLRPRGRVVLLDMNGQCPLYRVMSWMDKNEIRASYPEVRQSTADTLSQLANDAGFQVRRVAHFAFLPNAISSSVVRMLRPFDAALSRLPFARRYAMRVGLVAEGR